MRFLLIVLLLTLSLAALAQNRYTIKGRINNADNGETLIGVSVGVKERPQQGSFGDESGYYILTLPQGEYNLIFKLIGYNTKQIKIKLNEDKTLNVDLEPEVVSLGEVEISAQRTNENVKNVQSGVDKLEIEMVNKIPVLLGERDILKTIQLLPGVMSAGEGNTGFYVRGGSNDQNLIMLDNATVASSPSPPS